MTEREQDNKNIKKEIIEDLDVEKTKELLKNNTFEFQYKDIKYRVRKPTYGEKKEAYEKRGEKHNQLLTIKNEDGNYRYKTISQLKKLYKERGDVDIDDLENRFTVLERQKEKYQLRLGEALKRKASDKDLELFRDELKKILIQQQTLTFEKTKLLEYSIENQLDVYTYTYLTYLVAEVYKDDKWVKLWNSWEEFENTPEDIVNEISFYAVLIVQKEI
jgi:hypothetical protein